MAQEAVDYIDQHLTLLVDNMTVCWESLYIRSEDGAYWELSYVGDRYETSVLTRVCAEYVQIKYGLTSETTSQRIGN